MFSLSGAAFALSLPLLAFAANDWSTPCHNGQCSYDINNSTEIGHANGTLTISGNVSAIADLTPAAGWQIIDCDPTASGDNHTFRAICTDTTGVCEHLYENGAINTIVRLPENCTAWPFARIVDEWTHENQTVPDAVVSALSRRDVLSVVRGITIDTQWHKVNVSHHGPVQMNLVGSSGDYVNVNGTQVTSRDVQERGLFDFKKNKDDTKTIDVSKSFTVIDQSKHCPAQDRRPAYDLSLKVEVEAKAHAQVKYGFNAEGTVVPPKLKKFEVFAEFDATLNGGLTVEAAASISIDSGKFKVFTAGIPGLSVSGILSIGPTFDVFARATAEAQADLSLKVDLAYQISGARLAFPTGSNAGKFIPSPTNLKLSANPHFSATGNLAAHLTPTVAFGLNAFAGVAKADVNLNIDAFARLDLSLNAAAQTGQGFTADGCAGVTTGLTVQAGAEGSFFSIFNKSTQVTIFSKEWQLWKKCFNRRRHARALAGAPSTRRTISARALVCSANEDTIGEGRDSLIDSLISNI